MKMDMNFVAVMVAANEGKVQELSIAQIKEVLAALKRVCIDSSAAAEVKEYLNV